MLTATAEGHELGETVRHAGVIVFVLMSYSNLDNLSEPSYVFYVSSFVCMPPPLSVPRVSPPHLCCSLNERLLPNLYFW